MFFSVCVLVCLLCDMEAYCQIVGGRANGQQAPEEAKAGSVRSGNYQGDVNLFNGTYSSSHSIGSVSTPTGLSFTAMLTYGGSFSGGNEVPFVSGIPYGEGWNLSVPSISVNVSAFHKYTEQQINAAYSNGLLNCDPQNPADTVDCLYLSPQDLEIEGELFYYSPMLSIPGVVSGRLVFKGIDNYYKKEPSVSGPTGPAAVFTLHSFDDVFVTAYYRWGEWDVRLPNGYRYLFNRGQGSVYSGENYRVQPDNNGITYPPASSGSVIPKGISTVWYVGSISNLNLDGDDILFDYETFGCFDYYKEFGQEGLGSAGGGGNILGSLKSCREVFLKSIRAKSGGILIERLDLEYESLRANTIVGDYSGDMLLLGQVGVHRKDSLYNYKSIWFQGQGNSNGHYSPVYDSNNGSAPNLSGWKRFKHVMSGGALPNEYFGSSSNPYLFNTIDFPLSYYRPESAPSVGGVSISFNHGFLESPQIDPNAITMPVGDIIEVRTFINSTNNPQWDFCNFDINIVSGRGINGSGFDNLSLGNPFYEDDYNTTRNISLFSTFNQAMKWNPLAGNNSTRGHLYTSNFFSMPNIPSSFGGFYIQVGAANSDNKFDLDMIQNNYICGDSELNVTGPGTFNSYSYLLANEGIDHLKPFQRMPNNFGIGLPWHLVHERYNVLDDTSLGDLFCPLSPKHYSFWWNASPIDEDYLNRPTLTDNFMLNSVELIRYSKNPYMLKRATHYKVNGLVASGEGSGLKKVEQYEMEYVVKNSVYYDAPSDGTNSYYSKNYAHHNILLSAIKEVPVNPTGEAGNSLSVGMPTTRFEYEVLLCQVPLAMTGISVTHLSDVVVLKRVVSPIGGVTELVYSGLDNSAFVWSYVDNHLYQNPDEATDATYEFYNSPIQLKIMPRVAEKVVYGKDNGDKRRWLYTYETKKVHNDCLTLSSAMTNLGSSSVGIGNDHFSPNMQSNREIGYVQTTVIEPGLTAMGLSPVSVYVHYTDTLGGLLFGKLKEVRKLMPGGSLLEVRSFRYEALLANAGKRALDGCSSVMDDIAGGVEPGLGRTVRFMEYYLRQSISNSSNWRYLNSYFTKLVRESVVKYHTNPDGNNLPVQTITEYAYFDAYVDSPTENNHRVTNSEGFGLLYAMYGEAEGMGSPPYQVGDYPLPLPALSASVSSFYFPFIAWGDPSWQLFSVKTYSPQQPDAYTRTEKLYYWDLLCMPVFVDDSAALATQDFMTLRFIQRYGLRNLMYEERQIVKASGKAEVFNATYYEYDRGWAMPRDITPVPTNFPVVIDPVVSPPCEVVSD